MTPTFRPGRAARLASLLLLAALLPIAGCDRMDRQRELEGSPYARQLREAIPRVEKAVGMTFRHPPAMAIRSKGQVREYVMQQFDESAPAAELAAREIVYKRLGGIPENLKLRDFLLDLYEEQVAGYYDARLDTLYVVEGADEQVTGITITHELVHALQDQYVNLDSIMRQRGDDDRLLAVQSVIEGQATYDGLMAMAGGLINATTNWDNAREQIRQARSSSPKLAAAPTLIQEELLFPYLSGAEFVRRFRERRQAENPLAKPPVSSEQVLHVQSYFDAPPDVPTPIALTGVSGAGYQNTLGEFDTRVLLYEQLRELQTANEAARGWDGDRIALLGGGADAPLVWASVWDTVVDAQQFADAVTRAMALRYGAAAPAGNGASRSFTAKGRTVTVTSGEVGGRPTVLVVDGAGAPRVTLANLQVGGDGQRR